MSPSWRKHWSRVRVLDISSIQHSGLTQLVAFCAHVLHVGPQNGVDVLPLCEVWEFPVHGDLEDFNQTPIWAALNLNAWGLP